MRVEVEAAGKTRTLDVTRDGHGYLVRVDGHAHHVDVAITERSWSLLIGTRSYEVTFAEQSGGSMLVHVNGKPVAVARGAAGRMATTGGGVPAHAGPQPVSAPMPGRIVKVLVEPGDTVAARQGVVVIEAMKMENELRSPKAGTVAEVRVTEGMSVEAKTVLVVVD